MEKTLPPLPAGVEFDDYRRWYRLFAAAPALLAACERGLDALACAVEVGGGDPATHLCCQEMRAAVALARGR